MKYFTFLLLCCLSMTALAQTFDYESVTVQYKLPAKTPFTTPFRTFSVRFIGEENLKRYGILPSELTAGPFKTERFKNVPEKGDLHLDVFVGKPEYLGVEKFSEKRKENDVEVTYYYFQGTIITPIHYELRDGARNLIEEKIAYDAAQHLHFRTAGNRSSSELSRSWEESKGIAISKHITDILESSLLETAKLVRDRFDDQVIKDEVNIFDIKKADKINAEFINTAFTKIKAEIVSNPLVTAWPETTKSTIKDLLTKGTKFSVEDKDERIVFAIAHYDLALLHALWGDLPAAKKHLADGRRADRKNYEYDQLQRFIESLDGRNVPDEFSSKAFVGQYEEGADGKLVQATPASTSPDAEDFSGKPAKTLDTVYAKNGDMIIGYVNAVHVRKKFADSELYDFSHLEIHPTNMAQEKVTLKPDDIAYLKHKNIHMKPLVTKVPLAMNAPVFLYRIVQLSDDQKLALMRTAYHESMPYVMNGGDYEIYQFAYNPTPDPKDDEFLNVSTGTKYSLGINNALGNDFAFCPAIVKKAEAKSYKLEEASLKSLVDDYNTCKK